VQNTSHAVMAQRVEAADSLDDFPTPPWATRALLEHGIKEPGGYRGLSVMEPACGRGHMSKVLREYFSEVYSSDIAPYGYGEQLDFLSPDTPIQPVDWIITNPPFRLAEQFIQKSLGVARKGVAMLVRTVFVESVGRHDRLFSQTPPTRFAQFTERVPMVKGRLDAKASTATGYGWIIWEIGSSGSTELSWIPACRKSLERPLDYELPVRAISCLPLDLTAKWSQGGLFENEQFAAVRSPSRHKQGVATRTSGSLRQANR